MQRRLTEKAMKLEFQREPTLINEDTSYYIIKTYKLHSNTPSPYFSTDGQAPENGNISPAFNALQCMHNER